MKLWVLKHGGSNDDKKVYENNIRTLLQCQTELEYNKQCNKFKQTWSIPFIEYFETNLEKNLKQFSWRWVLESRDIYNPYSGITNNVRESLNASLKRLVDYKETPLDQSVL